MADETRHQVNLLDFLAFLLRWRVFLITLIIATSAIVAGISFIVRPKYRSTAIVRGTEESNKSLAGLLGSKMSSLAGVAGFTAGFGEVPGELLIAILKSRWMSEQAIAEFQLARVYRMEKQPIEDVIKTFLARTQYELDEESQAVIIKVDDEDTGRAKRIADFLVTKLDGRNQELRVVNAKREREFVGQRLDEARIQLAALEDSLMRYQESTGIVLIEEQAKATIGAAAVLEAQRLATISELEMKSMIFGSTNAETGLIRIRLASLDSSIARLSQNRGGPINGQSLMLDLQDAPHQGMTFLRFKRDIEIQQVLMAILLQQFEQARIDEHRNTPTIVILDPAVEATQRIWPKRGMMVLIAAMGSFIFGVVIALVIEFFRDAGKPGHVHYSSVQQIQAALQRRR